MSLHIKTEYDDDIAKLVIMPGDPVRVKFIAEKQQDKENIEKIEKNQIIFDEKLKKIQQFLIENKEQIQCIGDLKNQILDMNNKLDVLLSERTLRH